jgi:hypothetical protein
VLALAGTRGEVGSGFEVFAVPAPTAHGGSESTGSKWQRGRSERRAGEEGEYAASGGPAPVQMTPAQDACGDQAEQQAQRDLERARRGAAQQMLNRLQRISRWRLSCEQVRHGCA